MLLPALKDVNEPSQAGSFFLRAGNFGSGPARRKLEPACGSSSRLVYLKKVYIFVFLTNNDIHNNK
ncbi:hypothetical protein Hanom_Chr13g01200861 [Helianthus anomalus]